MTEHAVLPSWRPGPTRDAVLTFLDGARQVPIDKRVACLDNDGTLWCEKPTYVQLDFFVEVMKTAVGQDPSLAQKEEFAALLSGDAAAIGELGLERIAFALAGLCAGLTPEEFTVQVREFLAGARHRLLNRPLLANTYQPMLELLEELRRLDFSVAIVTGGGTEFVRARQPGPVRRPTGSGRRDAYRVPLLRRRRPPGPAPVHEPAGCRQRGGRQGVQHPGPARPAADPRRWELGWRSGDARMGGGRRGPHAGAARRPRRRRARVQLRQCRGDVHRSRAHHCDRRRLGWTVASMARDWETVFSPVEGV